MALGPVLVQHYGRGEVTGCITSLRREMHGNPCQTGTRGVVRTGLQIEIQDLEGRSLPLGETREICVVGTEVCAGYFNNPEANSKSFRNGWFLTGDLGYFNANGFLNITGRASEMYIFGGSNISPREIEEELLEHETVREVCVFGVPDEKWGEAGVAIVVVKKPDSTAGDALRSFLKERLTGYKVPGTIEIRDALPKSPNCKIVRKDVRADCVGTQSAVLGARK